MVLKGDLVKRSRGFAIESHPENSFGSRPADCSSKSDLFSDWIVNCTGNIFLRMLTREETVQLAEYQLDTISEFGNEIESIKICKSLFSPNSVGCGIRSDR